MKFAADYSETVQRLFETPGNAGVFDESNDVVRGTAGDRATGAVIEISLKIGGGRIRDARFRAYGCPHTIAAASRTATTLVGAPLSALEAFDPHELAAELEVPPDKLGRLLLIEDALTRCREDIGKSG